MKNNGYTSVSPKGCAVVDYCIVSQDALMDFKDFEVVLVKDIFDNAGCTGTVELKRKQMSDHSIIRWTFPNNSGAMCDANVSVNNDWNSTFILFERNSIPENFMVDCGGIMETYKRQLKETTIEQDVTDQLYEEFCKTVKAEMLSKLK